MKACVFLLSAGGLLLAGSGLASGQSAGPPPAGAPAAQPPVVVTPPAAPAPVVVTPPSAPPAVVTTAPPAAPPASAVQAAPAGPTQQVQIFTAPPPAVPPPPPAPPPAPVVVVPAAPPPSCPACPVVPTVYAAPAERAGRHTHDGFFLRLSAGGGYLGARDERGTGNATFHGGAGSFALALGGAVSDNLIIYGEGLGQQVDTGELKLAYDRRRDGSFNVKGSMGLYGGGPGLAYYFMPYNTYVSGTLLFTRLVWSEDDLGEEDSEADNEYSEPGVGLSLSVGKEWWVSSNWGLGVAARLNYSSNEHASNRPLDRFGDTTQSSGDRRFDTWGVSVALSATFN